MGQVCLVLGMYMVLGGKGQMDLAEWMEMGALVVFWWPRRQMTPASHDDVWSSGSALGFFGGGSAGSVRGFLPGLSWLGEVRLHLDVVPLGYPRLCPWLCFLRAGWVFASAVGTAGVVLAGEAAHSR